VNDLKAASVHIYTKCACPQ